MACPKGMYRRAASSLREHGKEMRMQEDDVDSSFGYQIGCRTRRVLRLLVLLTLAVAILFLLYLVLGRFTDSPLFVLVLSTTCAIFHQSLSPTAGARVLFIMKDGADGWVRESGIEYHTLFRNDFVPWSQIRQLEYLPRSGQIRIYLSSARFPLQFGRCKRMAMSNTYESTVLDLLKQKIQLSGGVFVEQCSGRQ